jgi:hypothetical protein
VIEHEQIVGKIALRSILGNKYTIELQAGAIWTFHLPLFSSRFQGKTLAGNRIWAMEGPGSKTSWCVLLEPGADSVYLLSSLAFIHLLRWREF